jgi:hypothetical protein
MAAEPPINFDSTEYWNEIARSDISVASAIIKTGKYFLCGLTCYKAAEKSFSGWFVKDRPKYLLPENSNLAEFSQLIGIHPLLPSDKQKLLLDLETFNTAAKSPTKKADFSATLTRDYCETCLHRTQELYDFVDILPSLSKG